MKTKNPKFWHFWHKKKLTPIIKILEDEPLEFEIEGQADERLRKRGWTRNFVRERYWFMMILNDTPYTQGEINLAGWNSQDDANRARE
tara:strand:+ start:836 stop:1099 length:264 start_codon:yes stop_codon:yes gene_type:complete